MSVLFPLLATCTNLSQLVVCIFQFFLQPPFLILRWLLAPLMLPRGSSPRSELCCTVLKCSRLSNRNPSGSIPRLRFTFHTCLQVSTMQFPRTLILPASSTTSSTTLLRSPRFYLQKVLTVKMYHCPTISFSAPRNCPTISFSAPRNCPLKFQTCHLQTMLYIQQTQVAPVTYSAPATTCDVCSSCDSAPATTRPAPVTYAAPQQVDYIQQSQVDYGQQAPVTYAAPLT